MLGTLHLAENKFSEMMKKIDDDLGLNTSLFSNILSLQKSHWKVLPKDKKNPNMAHESAQKRWAPRAAGWYHSNAFSEMESWKYF